MKRILLIFFIVSCSAISRAQLRDTVKTTTSPQPDADLLFHKAHKQKTTAWILLGAGAGVSLAGFIIAANAADKDLFGFASSTAQAGTVMMLAGAAAMVASVPFFLSSGHNRKEAMLLLTTGHQSFLRQPYKGTICSLGLSIKL